jgi:D-alanine-D-alanine ligase
MMNTIAIVCGGYSKEEVISLRSAEQILQVIDRNLFNAYTVLITPEHWVAKLADGDYPVDKNNFSVTHHNQTIKFDAVFMAIHGTPGEDGKLQGYFEMLGIPVTTCNTFVSALTFNKYACKMFLASYNILTAKAVLVRRGDTVDAAGLVKKLGLPMFVKPNNGGSSFGVTKVKTIADVAPAFEKAFAEDYEVIVEEFIEGREFTNGIFVSGQNEIVLPITEIVPKNEFFDFDAKYKGLSEEITPARLSDDQTKACQLLTASIYKLLGCNGVVRIDYLFKDNRFYFMEVNTVPGMSNESIIPQQARAQGYTITNFYTMLIQDAIDRNTKG